jgi:hypothetical protein
LAARRFTESAGGRFGFWRSIERISLAACPGLSMRPITQRRD